MLKLIESHIGRSPFNSPIAPSANHARDAFIAWDIDRIIPCVELRLDLWWHVHPANLQGRSHTTLGHARGECGGVNHSIHIPNKSGPNGRRRAALRPRCRMRGDVSVSLTLHDG